MKTVHNAPVTPERIRQLAWGYAPPLILEAALRHRVFDVLDGASKTIQEIHQATGASVRGLTAILNALVGLELLGKEPPDRFSLTPESAAFLVSTKPGFQGGLILRTSQSALPRWLHLTEVVATGQPVQAVNQQAPGSEFFQKLVLDLFPINESAARTLAQHLTLSSTGQPVPVLDLAAGSGVWGLALAQSSEQVRVTALDWPEVIPMTRQTVARFGLTDRFSFLEGDLLEADFGGPYRVATLGHILHSEGEPRSRALLAKVFRALDSGGTIAIAEYLVNPDRTGPVSGLLFAVNMLVSTEQGNTYSFQEISRWLSEAGFGQARLLEAPGPSPLILATKP
jgi:ubiquinone/menaquinone biosynthesis C-methylase UbiE